MWRYNATALRNSFLCCVLQIFQSLVLSDIVNFADSVVQWIVECSFQPFFVSAADGFYCRIFVHIAVSALSLLCVFTHSITLLAN